MTKLQELAYRIDCARDFFRLRERRDLIDSVHLLVEAAAVTGQGLTLNAPQTDALRVYLDSVIALRETRVIEQAAVLADAPANVIPLPIARQN
jgi:hypothetical protein